MSRATFFVRFPVLGSTTHVNFVGSTKLMARPAQALCGLATLPPIVAILPTPTAVAPTTTTPALRSTRPNIEPMGSTPVQPSLYLQFERIYFPTALWTDENLIEPASWTCQLHAKQPMDRRRNCHDDA